MYEEEAKRLLTPSRQVSDRFFLMDWTLNLYRGCNHGCVYCDSRSECYHIDRFDLVRPKRDALSMLRRELRARRKAGIVFMGAASDPYNTLEQRLLLTKGALELLLQYGFGVGMSTKSDLIARDAELLNRFSGRAPVMTAFSVTTADDGLALLLEPGAPPPSRRFSAMRALADAGVMTGTWLNPMLPFLTDDEENVRRVVALTKRHGGRFVICHYGMTLRAGDREYFYQALEKQPRFRGVKRRYADAFGLDYLCPSPDAEKRRSLLRRECEQAGLYFRFKEINEAQKAECPQQTTLMEHLQLGASKGYFD